LQKLGAIGKFASFQFRVGKLDLSRYGIGYD
jgi:hypothetical protein